MTIGVITQATSELLDWSINWDNRGLGSDVISASSWSSPDPSLVLSNQSFTGASSTTWVQGSLIGRYTIVNTVTTTGGRSMTESLIVNIIPPALKLV